MLQSRHDCRCSISTEYKICARLVQESCSCRRGMTEFKFNASCHPSTPPRLFGISIDKDTNTDNGPVRSSLIASCSRVPRDFPMRQSDGLQTLLPLCTGGALSTLFLVPNEALNCQLLLFLSTSPFMLRWNILSALVVCSPFLATELHRQHVNPLSACGRIRLIGCQLVRYFD